MPTYARKSPYLGAVHLVFSKAKFLETAVSHGMAVNLEQDGQSKKAQERGRELLEKWEATYRTDYEEMRDAICSALWSSFFTIFLVSALAVVVGVYTGRIGVNFPLDVPKTLAFAGTALVAWATLMELGGDFPVWDGKAFPQIAHSVVFKTIFVPGVAMLLLATAQ